MFLCVVLLYRDLLWISSVTPDGCRSSASIRLWLFLSDPLPISTSPVALSLGSRSLRLCLLRKTKTRTTHCSVTLITILQRGNQVYAFTNALNLRVYRYGDVIKPWHYLFCSLPLVFTLFLVSILFSYPLKHLLRPNSMLVTLSQCPLHGFCCKVSYSCPVPGI